MAFFTEQDLRNRGKSAIGSTYSNQQNYSTLINESNTKTFSAISGTAKEYDIFLSHSFKDAELVYGLLTILKGMGYSVYVDWINDRQMSRDAINKDTANTLRLRMNQSKCLFYASTDNSINSKWMPWELGYMDARKDKVAVIPIKTYSTGNDNYTGQEYLSVYPYVLKNYVSNRPDLGERLWIHETQNIYVFFDEWLVGYKPSKH